MRQDCGIPYCERVDDHLRAQLHVAPCSEELLSQVTTSSIYEIQAWPGMVSADSLLRTFWFDDQAFAVCCDNCYCCYGDHGRAEITMVFGMCLFCKENLGQRERVQRFCSCYCCLDYQSARVFFCASHGHAIIMLQNSQKRTFYFKTQVKHQNNLRHRQGQSLKSLYLTQVLKTRVLFLCKLSLIKCYLLWASPEMVPLVGLTVDSKSFCTNVLPISLYLCINNISMVHD